MTITAPECIRCRHLHEGLGFKCAAFPDGVPEAILEGEVRHREPYPGDHGIQFEPIENMALAPTP